MVEYYYDYSGGADVNNQDDSNDDSNKNNDYHHSININNEDNETISSSDDDDDNYYTLLRMISLLLHHCPQALAMPTKEAKPQNPLCLALNLQKQRQQRRDDDEGGNKFLPLILKLKTNGSASIPNYDGLYPFAIAAANDCDLTLIYSLLLASPHVLGHVVNNNNED